ncbi:TetR/AcrR family transcriptional regulator [Flavobacterium sp.]|uniref:TetR/AcrR family transcriptional regulator n=1 Tax=Flavobacterium sp. TaxID=239 RepID=UPI0039E6B2FC
MGRNLEFNKEETVKKAMNVFWEKGYNGTSMQDLVDAMQINRSSLYNTIGDKQQLFHECVSSYADQVMEETKQKAANEKSPLQALIRIIRDKSDWIVESDKGCLGVKTIFEVAQTDETVRNLLCKNNDVYLKFMTDLIQRAMDAGEIDNSEDAGMMAEYIMMSFTGWKQSYILQGNPIKVKKMADFLIKSIVHNS